MNVILIPGFWLNDDSWSEIADSLRAAGHTVHPVTLPGMQSVETDRSGITLRDHIDAVIALVDSLSPGDVEAGVVLVGHSGGGAVVHGVVDARPAAIARVIYVDSLPLGDGDVINDELPVVDDEIPLPDWSVFEEADLTDLDDALRAQFRDIAIPTPVRVATDKQVLTDPRRYDVPVTAITCEFPSSMIRELLEAGHPYVAELGRITTVELVDLPTGHWPQLTKPKELASVMIDVLRRATV